MTFQTSWDCFFSPLTVEPIYSCAQGPVRQLSGPKIAAPHWSLDSGAQVSRRPPRLASPSAAAAPPLHSTAPVVRFVCTGTKATATETATRGGGDEAEAAGGPLGWPDPVPQPEGTAPPPVRHRRHLLGGLSFSSPARFRLAPPRQKGGGKSGGVSDFCH